MTVERDERVASGSSADAARDALIRRRVVMGTFSNYAGRAVTLGTWFLLTPFILHRLGASTYGLWTLVSSVVAYGALLDLGIGTAVTKFVAEHRVRGTSDEARALVATSAWSYAALGLLAFCLCAALAPFVPAILTIPADERGTAVSLVLLMGSALAISLVFATPGAVLRGLQRYDLINAINVFGTIVVAAATVAILRMGGGVVVMTASHVAVLLATQVLQVWAVRRVAPQLRFKRRYARWTLLRPIAAFTAPIFVTNVAGQLQSRTDAIVIGAFMSVGAVTPFSIALKLGELSRILTDQFLRVLLPLASELHAESDPARLRELYVDATRVTLAIVVPVGCMVTLLAGPILTAWVGAEYAPYGYLVAILTAAIIIDTTSWPAGLILQGMARHRPLALMAICSGVANLVLSIVLVRRFGLAGVALGTLIPTAVEIVAFVMPYASRVIGVGARDVLDRVVLPVLPAAVASSLVLVVVQRIIEPTTIPRIVLEAGIGGIVYAAAYLAIGAGDFEREILDGLVRNQTLMKIRWR